MADTIYLAVLVLKDRKFDTTLRREPLLAFSKYDDAAEYCERAAKSDRNNASLRTALQTLWVSRSWEVVSVYLDCTKGE